MQALKEHKQKDVILKVYNDLASGLLYNHTRNTFNTERILEASSFLYALIELLNEKGILSIDEIDERKKGVADRLIQRFTKSGIGLLCQDQEFDKYTFEHNANVDCESRLHICKAICCKFPFALSKQDIEEGIIRWDFGRPYLIAHNKGGYCIHLGSHYGVRVTLWGHPFYYGSHYGVFYYKVFFGISLFMSSSLKDVKGTSIKARESQVKRYLRLDCQGDVLFLLTTTNRKQREILFAGISAGHTL